MNVTTDLSFTHLVLQASVPVQLSVVPLMVAVPAVVEPSLWMIRTLTSPSTLAPVSTLDRSSVIVACWSAVAPRLVPVSV